ncbi:conserved hypothetical protein [Trichinella spiralis]|uniref:hypothetical protein n=1 Tax=Trichinella spiralis TaxID=6334 RepID=UPI0001EFECEE|nr:conserved hypothetical protein [Trichinella spiralis]
MLLAIEKVIVHHQDVAIAAPSFLQWAPQVQPHSLEAPANRVDLHQGLSPFRQSRPGMSALDSWPRTACRLFRIGHRRSGVVVQAGGQLRIHTLPAAPASGLPALGSRKFLSHLNALWSAWAVNFLLYRYDQKWRVAQTMASTSRRMAQYFCSGCDNDRLT